MLKNSAQFLIVVYTCVSCFPAIVYVVIKVILIIFGERSESPRICESQTSKITVQDFALLADCARALKIQNGRHKTRAIKVV